jgi:hypothetical protein
LESACLRTILRGWIGERMFEDNFEGLDWRAHVCLMRGFRRVYCL